MHNAKKIVFLCIGIVLNNCIVAGEYIWHATLGVATPKFTQSQQLIWVNQYMQNQYKISAGSQNSPLFGLGVMYSWKNKNIEFDLGPSFYYMQTDVSGVNTPFINEGSYSAVKYQATGNSYALLLEPKIVVTHSRWQPYLLGGVGWGLNNFYGYHESAEEAGAAATLKPFRSNTINNVAYEIGIGIQHPLTRQAHSPIIALDYRYMNWGNTGLNEFSGQTIGQGLHFGVLYASVINLNLLCPF